MDFQEILNKELLDKYKAFLDKYNRLKSDFMELVIKSEDICHYCKNNIECKGEKCEKYCEGKGGYGQDGQHFPEWKWTCKDFDFGTCPLLENTPCNECFDNDCKGFEWSGNNV